MNVCMHFSISVCKAGLYVWVCPYVGMNTYLTILCVFVVDTAQALILYLLRDASFSA